MDIASLKIKVDTSEAKKASNDLNKLSSASRGAQKSSEGLTSAFISMRGALAAVGISASIGQITRTMDSYTKLTSQLKLATQNQLEFNEAYKNVQRIAEVSQSSLEETGVLYARLSTALREMGATQTQVSDVTEAVSLGLKISGASAAESASAMLQLSQAFSSGVLRGEEFNAVNEAAPRLMTALAEGIGVARGELRQMAQDGKLTSDIVGNALLKSLQDFRKEAKLTQNISGGLTGISNEFTLMVGEIDKATGASKALAWAFKEIANAIKEMRTSDGGWLSWAIKATPLRGLESIIPKSNAEGREQSGMIRKAGETGTLQAPKRIAETPAPISSANLKSLTDARKKATDEANKEEIRRLNVAIWVNEQIALSEQKKNEEIAMYTERRMDIEQKRANENFEEAQRIYKEQLDAEQKLVEESKKGFEDLERAIDGYAKSASAAMTDFIFGSKTSFGDMVNSMLKDLARLALQKSIFDPLVTGITGALGGSGGIGGFFKSLLPGFANGTEYVPKDMVANIHQGERVLTREENRNYSQGMGGNVSVNVNVNSDGSSSVQSDASFGKQLGNAIKATVQAELLKQKRQGGLLA